VGSARAVLETVALGADIPNNVDGAGYNEACYAHDICHSSSGMSKADCDAKFGMEVAALIGFRGHIRPPLQTFPGSSLILGLFRVVQHG
jgi:hypothetical protein